MDLADTYASFELDPKSPEMQGPKSLQKADVMPIFAPIG
jgi:hypothetical protein